MRCVRVLSQELSSVLKYMDSVPGRMEKMASDSESLLRLYSVLVEFHVALPKVGIFG